MFFLFRNLDIYSKTPAKQRFSVFFLFHFPCRAWWKRMKTHAFRNIFLFFLFRFTRKSWVCSGKTTFFVFPEMRCLRILAVWSREFNAFLVFLFGARQIITKHKRNKGFLEFPVFLGRKMCLAHQENHAFYVFPISFCPESYEIIVNSSIFDVSSFQHVSECLQYKA